MTDSKAPTMLEETRKMLRNRPNWLTFRIIADETKLPFHWLKSLARDTAPANPGVTKVETLYRYLKEKTENV